MPGGGGPSNTGLLGPRKRKAKPKPKVRAEAYVRSKPQASKPASRQRSSVGGAIAKGVQEGRRQLAKPKPSAPRKGVFSPKLGGQALTQQQQKAHKRAEKAKAKLPEIKAERQEARIRARFPTPTPQSSDPAFRPLSGPRQIEPLARAEHEKYKSERNREEAVKKLPSPPLPKVPLLRNPTPKQETGAVKLFQRSAKESGTAPGAAARKWRDEAEIKGKRDPELQRDVGVLDYYSGRKRAREGRKAGFRDPGSYEAFKSAQIAQTPRVTKKVKQKDPAPLAKLGPKIAGIPTPRLDLTALRVLEETARPGHAIAGAVKKSQEGGSWKDIGEAAAKGIQNKEKYTMSDLPALRHHSKGVRFGLGLGAGVLTDPTTFATAGVAVPAKVAGRVGQEVIKSGARKAAPRSTPRGGTTPKARMEAGIGGVRAERAANRAARRRLRGVSPSNRQRIKVAEDTASTRARRKVESVNKERAAQGRKPLSPKKAASVGRSIHAREGQRFKKKLEREGERTGQTNKGIQLGFGGLKTSGKGSAYVSRKTGASGLAKTIKTTPAIEGIAKSITPGLKTQQYEGAQGERAFRTGREASRERRNRVASERKTNQMIAKEVARRLPDQEAQARVIRALETPAGGTGKGAEKWAAYVAKREEGAAPAVQGIESLQGEERKVAEHVKRIFRETGEAEVKAGLMKPEALREDYVPHNLDLKGKTLRKVLAAVDEGDKAIAKLEPKLQAYAKQVQERGYKKARLQASGEGTGTGGKLGASKQRMEELDKPMHELGEKNPFKTNLPEVILERLNESTVKQANAAYWNHMARMGRRVSPGRMPKYNAATHSIYKLESDGLKRVEDTSGLAGGKADGSHVLIRDSQLEDFLMREAGRAGPLMKKLAGSKNPDAIARGYDRLLGLWKTAVTVPMPSYHLRNLYGDLFNAWASGISAPELAKNLLTHAGPTRRAAALQRRQRGQLVPGEYVSRKGKVKPDRIGIVNRRDVSQELKKLSRTGITVDGSKISYLQLARDAEKHGVVGSGFSRDIDDLLRGKAVKGTGKGARAMQAREDVVRLATYISRRKQGISSREAAEHVRSAHFDYSDLTPFERDVLRRFLPFYTWMRRNTAFQAKSLAARPGKYATLEKVIEEGAKGAGLPENWRENLPDYVEHGAPIPIPSVTQKGMPLLAMPGLPVTDLNRLSVNPKRQYDLLMASVGWPKAIVEVMSNYSFYFKGEIDKGDKVAAPDWIGEPWAAPLRKITKAEKQYDQQRKVVWKWHPNAGYLAAQLPETNLLTSATTSGRSRRGQDPKTRLTSMTGVRLQPYDPLKDKQLPQQYEKLDEIAQELRDMNKRPGPKGSTQAVGRDNYYTKQYERLLDKQGAEQRTLRELVKKQLIREGVPRQFWEEILPQAPKSPAQKRKEAAQQADPLYQDEEGDPLGPAAGVVPRPKTPRRRPKKYANDPLAPAAGIR